MFMIVIPQKLILDQHVRICVENEQCFATNLFNIIGHSKSYFVLSNIDNFVHYNEDLDAV